MGKIQFNRHTVNARKDLLHFVEEHADREVYKHLGEKPDEWKDELHLISGMLSGEGLVALSGMNNPPIDCPGFEELGKDVFLYRGEQKRERGLWRREILDEKTAQYTGRTEEWTQYNIGTKAVVNVNKKFSDIPLEIFLPENFERISEEIKKEKGVKRPIWKFPVQTNGEERNVYAKGADITHGFYFDYAKPRFRLTSISSVHKTTSRSEMQKTINLANMGINVPDVIGHYEGMVEEFLFLSEVQGKSPDEFFSTHRREIIQQDAEMLAKVCQAGYRKQGFHDTDDKIFDGKDLHLIDVDECVDIYFGLRADYRKILLNPRDTSGLREFRRMQGDLFKTALKDALSEYKNSLTPTREEMHYYAKIFYQTLGWKEPSTKQLTNLLDFPENYMTQDRYMALMMDTD